MMTAAHAGDAQAQRLVGERFGIIETGHLALAATNVTPGYLPASAPHAFRIRGVKPARLLGLALPGSIFHLYDEVGIPAGELRLPGPDGQTPDVGIGRWVELSGSYGLELVGPPIPG